MLALFATNATFARLASNDTFAMPETLDELTLVRVWLATTLGAQAVPFHIKAYPFSGAIVTVSTSANTLILA